MRRKLGLTSLVLAVVLFCSGCSTLTGVAGSVGLFLSRFGMEDAPREYTPLYSALSDRPPLTQEEYYGYSILNDKEREIYLRLVAAVETFSPYINLEPYHVPVEDFRRIFAHYRDDHPHHFWLFSGKAPEDSADPEALLRSDPISGEMLDVRLNYSFSREETEKMIGAIEEKSRTLLAGIQAGLSEYETARQLHDRLAEHISYDDTHREEYIHTIYGSLVQGRAVCSGYSKAYQFLLYQCGIQALFVRGVADGENHAWNIVKIDSLYCHTDLTWDDTQSYPDLPPVPYLYFNLSDEQILADHTLAAEPDDYPLPDCPSDRMEYYRSNGCSFITLEGEGAARLLTQLREAIRRKDSFLVLRVPPEGNVEAFTEELRQELYSVISRINRFSPSPINPRCAFYADPTTRIIRIRLEYR
ncbi:MAG: hypothetical protein IJY82_04355 [Oscillospiraceae bacterium]|nr:hypothetical protein [Oscillospiraceae bacterium]